MKTIDRNVRGLGKKPFAAFALLGLLGFGFDMAVNTTINYADKNPGSVVESSFLDFPAQAVGGAAENSENSSQTIEAKARLLFKKNEFSSLPQYWLEGMTRFNHLTER